MMMMTMHLESLRKRSAIHPILHRQGGGLREQDLDQTSKEESLIECCGFLSSGKGQVSFAIYVVGHLEDLHEETC